MDRLEQNGEDHVFVSRGAIEREGGKCGLVVVALKASQRLEASATMFGTNPWYLTIHQPLGVSLGCRRRNTVLLVRDA